MLFSISTLTLLAGFACAQFPVEPSDVAVVTSELNSEVQITYKEVVRKRCDSVDSLLIPVHSPGKFARLRLGLERSRDMCIFHRVS